MRTVADVIAGTKRHGLQLAAPEYKAPDHTQLACVGLGVASMKHHMTDEGWQLFEALAAGGYTVFGHGYRNNSTHVGVILDLYSPDVVVVQDKREWVGKTAGPGFDHRERFHGVSELAKRRDIFKLTVLKDAHSDGVLHMEAAQEAGVHGWVVYYHPGIVAAQAPFCRKEHLVRTWHSLDPAIVPHFGKYHRYPRGLLSGAVSGAYPLRSRLAMEATVGRLANIAYLRHPGYGREVCRTQRYMETLAQYKVAVCTSSRFGYAVRKIAEATAAGCVVVTDLPSDDVLPAIDGNLVRIDSDMSPSRVDALVGDLAAKWNADSQREWVERAVAFYDYRALGRKLAADIETLRRSYK